MAVFVTGLKCRKLDQLIPRVQRRLHGVFSHRIIFFCV